MKISSSRYSCQKTQFLAMNHNLQRNLSPSSFLNHIHKVPEHFATEADEVINTDESRFCNQRQSLDFYLPSIKRARNIHKKQQVSCQELPQRLELDLLQSPREEIKLKSQKHLDEYQKIKPTLKRNFFNHYPIKESNLRKKFLQFALKTESKSLQQIHTLIENQKKLNTRNSIIFFRNDNC